MLSNSISFAVATWSKSLSNEVANHNITISNVLTGYFDTERLQKLIKVESADTCKSIEEIREAGENKIPMKRLGKPEKYGHLVAFLASEYAAYIIGTSIPLDGGLANVY